MGKLAGWGRNERLSEEFCFLVFQNRLRLQLFVCGYNSHRNYRKKIISKWYYVSSNVLILSPYLSAFRTPAHVAADTGGIKRSDPVGGEAYGTPLNTSTGSKLRASNCTIVPDTAPFFVWTIRDDIWGWAWLLVGSRSSPLHVNGSVSAKSHTITNIFDGIWIFADFHLLF